MVVEVRKIHCTNYSYIWVNCYYIMNIDLQRTSVLYVMSQEKKTQCNVNKTLLKQIFIHNVGCLTVKISMIAGDLQLMFC